MTKNKKSGGKIGKKDLQIQVQGQDNSKSKSSKKAGDTNGVNQGSKSKSIPKPTNSSAMQSSTRPQQQPKSQKQPKTKVKTASSSSIMGICLGLLVVSLAIGGVGIYLSEEAQEWGGTMYSQQVQPVVLKVRNFINSYLEPHVAETPKDSQSIPPSEDPLKEDHGKKLKEKEERERREQEEEHQRKEEERKAELERKRKIKEEAEKKAEEDRKEKEKKEKEERKRKEKEEAERKVEEEEKEKQRREEQERKKREKEEAERKAELEKKEKERKEEEKKRREKEEAEKKAEKERKEIKRKEEEERKRKEKEEVERKAEQERKEKERKEEEERKRKIKEEADKKAEKEQKEKERKEEEERKRKEKEEAEKKAEKERKEKEKEEEERKRKEKESVERKAEKERMEREKKEEEARKQKVKQEGDKQAAQDKKEKERKEAEEKIQKNKEKNSDDEKKSQEVHVGEEAKTRKETEKKNEKKPESMAKDKTKETNPPSEKPQEADEPYEFASITNVKDFKIKDELDEADRLYDEDDYEGAIRKYDSILKQSHLSPRGMYGKGLTLDRLGFKHMSNEYLEQAINFLGRVLLLPDVPDELFLMAGRKLAERQHFRGWGSKAVKTFTLMLERFPEDIKLRCELGVTYMMIGRNEQAKDVFEQVLQFDPNSGFAKAHIGFIYKTSHDDAEKAIPLLREGIESGDEGTSDGRFYIQLGDALIRVGKEQEARHYFKQAETKGLFLSRWQRSLYNVKELTGRPFWTAKQMGYEKYIEILEKNWKTIRDEGLAQLDEKSGSFLPEEENLRDTGEWKQFTLYQQGRKNQDNCAKVPKTCAILDQIPPATGCRRGQIKFSVMSPGIHVWPHTGPTNCRLRSHLGLVVPDGPILRVVNETRTWTEGKVMTFDDSFEHEVWHKGTKLRLILIVDFWHPEVTDKQRRTLSPI